VEMKMLDGVSSTNDDLLLNKFVDDVDDNDDVEEY